LNITLISDTHGYHRNLKRLEGEMIIHAGDISSKGTLEEVKDFMDWYQKLNFDYKIFIAGNHDFYFEQASDSEIKALIPDNLIYLNDSGVTINNLNIWGSPIQPFFLNWAFNKKRGNEIMQHWKLIPDDTDILITHGPPLNILDRTIFGKNVGCEDLLNKTIQIKPSVHVFGHIHENRGIEDIDETKFINASLLDEKYKLVNQPIEIVI